MRITLKRNILRAGGAAVALPMMESFTPFARAADGKRPVKRSGWVVHAYVLMGNHYRLILETAEPDLVRGMTWFQTTDTVRYDVRHGTAGDLYRGRYKAVLVEASEGGRAGEADYFSWLAGCLRLAPEELGTPGGFDRRPVECPIADKVEPHWFPHLQIAGHLD